jgi:hypothetical protein
MISIFCGRSFYQKGPPCPLHAPATTQKNPDQSQCFFREPRARDPKELGYQILGKAVVCVPTLKERWLKAQMRHFVQNPPTRKKRLKKEVIGSQPPKKRTSGMS